MCLGSSGWDNNYSPDMYANEALQRTGNQEAYDFIQACPEEDRCKIFLYLQDNNWEIPSTSSWTPLADVVFH